MSQLSSSEQTRDGQRVSRPAGWILHTAMATPFQPERPHRTARGSRNWASTVATAFVAALMVSMVFALGMAQAVAAERSAWVVTLLAGAGTFIIVLTIGFLRGPGENVLRDEDLTNRGG